MHFEAVDAHTPKSIKEILQDAQYIADTVLRERLEFESVHFHTENDKFVRIVSRGQAKVVGEYAGKRVYEYALGV